MIRRAGALARGDPAGSIPDVGKGEEEEEEDGMGLGLPTTMKNCLPRRGISVLEKLVKTCPVWLQLGLGYAEAARILHREAAGMFLVRRDSSLKHLVLCVHFPSLKESSSEVLEYTIKEEKSSKYLSSPFWSQPHSSAQQQTAAANAARLTTDSLVYTGGV
ncbi:ras and Rab interactor 3-like [Otolemur garnettii]|uniref:ras and Rab interactor 3-like n=1 Tax=Otolemur garnettii TaxID=30611 RepID=UPI000C7EE152|nr:ras and Rab interactor 3-like [Otolemur garnettii]